MLLVVHVIVPATLALIYKYVEVWAEVLDEYVIEDAYPSKTFKNLLTPILLIL